MPRKNRPSPKEVASSKGDLQYWKAELARVAGMARAKRLRVATVKPLIRSRGETEIVPAADNAWVLQEATIAYGQETDLKNASKAIKCDGFCVSICSAASCLRGSQLQAPFSISGPNFNLNLNLNLRLGVIPLGLGKPWRTC